MSFKIQRSWDTKLIQCPPLNRITLAQYKSDTNNPMIQLTDVFCVVLRYKWASNFWLQWAADSILRDPIKRRVLYLELRVLKSVNFDFRSVPSLQHYRQQRHSSGVTNVTSVTTKQPHIVTNPRIRRSTSRGRINGIQRQALNFSSKKRIQIVVKSHIIKNRMLLITQ